jgi:hypothetical protein
MRRRNTRFITYSRAIANINNITDHNDVKITENITSNNELFFNLVKNGYSGLKIDILCLVSVPR